MIELGRSTERLPTDASGAKTASSTPSASPPQDTAEDILGDLSRSVDHLLMVASGGQAAQVESSTIGWYVSSAVIQVKFFYVRTKNSGRYAVSLSN